MIEIYIGFIQRKYTYYENATTFSLSDGILINRTTLCIVIYSGNISEEFLLNIGYNIQARNGILTLLFWCI